MKPITETLDVLAAGVALSLRTRNSLADDGRISTYEKLGYLSEVPKLLEAFKGIKDVPGELADLDEEETAALSAKVSAMLHTWGVSHRIQDITAELMRASVELVRSIVRIVNLPPSAVAV